MIADQGYQFPMLTDANLALSDQLNLTHGFSEELKAIYLQFGIDVAKSNGSEDWRLPMPARFILDAKGTITDAQVNPDYTTRPEPAAILGLLPTSS